METAIAVLALVAIAAHLVLRWLLKLPAEWPLWVALAGGGTPLVGQLLRKAWRREFGSDLLAGISIVTAALLGEYLAGVLVVLMLSGGEALEGYAVRSASSVLRALARRMPSVAHRRRDAVTEDVPLEAVEVGDLVVVHPHEICPVDGVVVEGRGVMDESYLTGEPYRMSKTTGATVLSGAINGESVLTVRAEKRAEDSRYAKIMRVMQESEQQRPRLRRLADQLGAWYTPLALAVAAGAWVGSGDAVRFLAVLVVATPCPLLIAIPVAIIGSISLAARRGISAGRVRATSSLAARPGMTAINDGVEFYGSRRCASCPDLVLNVCKRVHLRLRIATVKFRPELHCFLHGSEIHSHKGFGTCAAVIKDMLIIRAVEDDNGNGFRWLTGCKIERPGDRRNCSKQVSSFASQPMSKQRPV